METLNTYYTFNSANKDGREFISGGWYETLEEAGINARKSLNLVGDTSDIFKIHGEGLDNQTAIVKCKKVDDHKIISKSA